MSQVRGFWITVWDISSVASGCGIFPSGLSLVVPSLVPQVRGHRLGTQVVISQVRGSGLGS